jgi:hypothetical protein
MLDVKRTWDTADLPVHRPVAMQAALARLRPYAYHFMLLALIPIAFYLDAQTKTIMQQNLLGVGAFIILFVSTRFSSRAERRQVWIMVGVATCVEVWSSIIWGVYRYRFGNVPLFVPWGHGLVYLFALRAARTPLLTKHARAAKRIAFVGATLWAIYGLTVEPLFLGRLDVLGALWWPIFAWFMRRPSAPIFAAAFFITGVLEIVGTSFGTWAWQVYAPISHIPSGNPPSVISAGYCVMDYISLQIAAALPAVPLIALWPRIRLRIFGTPSLRARVQPQELD